VTGRSSRELEAMQLRLLVPTLVWRAFPHIINLIIDPKEREPYNYRYLHTWRAEPALRPGFKGSCEGSWVEPDLEDGARDLIDNRRRALPGKESRCISVSGP
jgi:hypothetical protein